MASNSYSFNSLAILFEQICIFWFWFLLTELCQNSSVPISQTHAHTAPFFSFSSLALLHCRQLSRASPQKERGKHSNGSFSNSCFWRRYVCVQNALSNPCTTPKPGFLPVKQASWHSFLQTYSHRIQYQSSGPAFYGKQFWDQVNTLIHWEKHTPWKYREFPRQEQTPS